MEEVIAHAMDSPTLGKYEAIDLDKIRNKIPVCKIKNEGEKSKWDRSGPVKKNNEPCIGQYKIEEQGDKNKDKTGKNWPFLKAKNLSFIDKYKTTHNFVPGPGKYPKFEDSF